MFEGAMTFQEPIYLAGTAAGLVVILLGVRAFSVRRRALETFSRLHPRLADGGTPARQAGEFILLAFALVLLSLSLAGPVSGERETGALREGIDICFCMDTSRSMQAMEGEFNRLDTAKRELRAMLERLSGDRVGLVAFAGGPRLLCPLTPDLEGFRHFMDALDVYSAPLAGSAPGTGLREAMEVLGEPSGREKVIVLLSDGENLDELHSPIEAAQEAAGNGIRIYTVMFGAPEGAKIPIEDEDGFVRDPEGREVISRPDGAAMARIAEAGGGAFIAASETAFPLDFLYMRHLAGLETSHQGDERLSREKSAFQWFGFFALLLLLFDMFLPFRRAGMAAALVFILWAPGPWAGAVQAADDDALNEGIRHFHAREFEAARFYFEQAASGDEAQPELHVNLGLTHLELGQEDAAAAFFERALRSGKALVVGAARFGSGLAAYRKAVRLSEHVADPRTPDDGKTLAEALRQSRKARAFFIGCIEAGAWPVEAAVNLELSNRMMDAVEKRLRAYRGEAEPPGGTDPGGSGSGQQDSGPGGGEGPVQTGEGTGAGEKEGGAAKEGEAGGDEDIPHIRLEEKQEIFAFLEALEQKRIALERAIEKASRTKNKEVKDW
jgi:Ca-activated chloride channel family protein